MSPVSHVKLPLNFSLDWCWNLGSRIRWMICTRRSPITTPTYLPALQILISTLSVGCFSIQGVTPARWRRMVLTRLTSVSPHSTLLTQGHSGERQTHR